MRAYTLHLPPAATTQAPILIAERFSWWALLFGPLWLMRHGVWWWGLGGLAATALAPWPVAMAVHLLCGLCGPDARRAALGRRGWQLDCVVVAANGDAALRRLLSLRPALAGLFRS